MLMRILVCAVAFLVVMPVGAQTHSQAQSWRTPWGDPDLQGSWSNATTTPLERPAKYAGREFLTKQEQAAQNTVTAVATDKRDEFKAHPARYAPRLLGCDPVTLTENDVAVRGSTQFGAFYDGSLFLFESAASRAKFRKAPTRYSQLKHVIKPEDVKKVASNSDP